MEKNENLAFLLEKLKNSSPEKVGKLLKKIFKIVKNY